MRREGPKPKERRAANKPAIKQKNTGNDTLDRARFAIESASAILLDNGPA